MFTNIHISEQYARLQSEFNIERDYINTVFVAENQKALDLYNKTLEANRQQYNNLLDDLTKRYNRLLKEIDNIISTYRSTVAQLTYTNNNELIESLQKTLYNLPDISKMYLNIQISIEDSDDLCYPIKISDELCRYLLPDTIPSETYEYLLKIEPYLSTFKNYLTIYAKNTCDTHTTHTIYTTKKYFVNVSKQLDMLIIEHDEIRDQEPIRYFIFMRLSTREYIIMDTKCTIKFMYYDNSVIRISYDCCTLVDYYLFEPKTLEYTIKQHRRSNIITFDNTYTSKNNKTVFNIYNDWIYRITYDCIDCTPNGREKIIRLDFPDLDLKYNIDAKYSIISFAENKLTIAYILYINNTDNTIKYIHIKIPHDVIQENLMYELI